MEHPFTELEYGCGGLIINNDRMTGRSYYE